MLQIIYFSGAFSAIALFVHIFLSKKFVIAEKILLYSASTLPLGKLIYFPIPGLVGLKIQFLIAALAGIYGLYKGLIQRGYVILFGMTALPIFSILWLEDYDWFLLNNIYGEGQTDSVGLRIVSLVLLILYLSFSASLIRRNISLAMFAADKFILGTFIACVIGVFIFIGVWIGNIAVEDLLPISVDTHVVDSFYRFNPGANVNEFSMILAYSIFLLALSSFSKQAKIGFLFIFLILEFATLTRASWIALTISLACALFFRVNSRRNIIITILFLCFFLLVLYLLYTFSPVAQDLIVSRTTIEIGASGEDRLEKFQYVFDRLDKSFFRILFGFGWATNLYVHNVYLQLLYEVGLIGLFVFLLYFMTLFGKVIFLSKSNQKASLFAIMLFVAISAVAHHTLYHVQTWFILAMVSAISFRSRQVYSEKRKLAGPVAIP